MEAQTLHTAINFSSQRQVLRCHQNLIISVVCHKHIPTALSRISI